MIPLSFTTSDVSAALGTPVSAVEVLELFEASRATVARLLVRRSGAPDVTVIAKLARGTDATAARREVQFFEQLAPRWDHPAPEVLGVHDSGDAVLLLTEDLTAAGYRVVGADVTDDQLRGAVDVLASLHALFWNDVADVPALGSSVTSSAQAWPPGVIAHHAAAVRAEADGFFAETSELSPSERAVLDVVVPAWERQFRARVEAGEHLTLVHGDFHVLGDIFFTDHDPRPKVIDWSELKPGLGPHDLAYALSALPARQPDAEGLLRYYWKALNAPGYSWDLCAWDFRFSVISNLFQSVFQHSVKWYRAALTTMDTLNSLSTLTEPPPATR
ncbi:phosphotransferase family protein [Kribbella speibonae]|uniref:Aminoglycoside phosphotransferase family protein n=1 Tax=Kribbella speibonae TaxID=1572660 RepID=A0ABY2A3C6_9ACTN|nr:aminoglycoside phosphotransferase family protein [Kribbella speibonae]TCC22903.1 aminoglycoside phosphotransferase family protein [Kribbella speibonae]